jgi:hypothetical protein
MRLQLLPPLLLMMELVLLHTTAWTRDSKQTPMGSDIVMGLAIVTSRNPENVRNNNRQRCRTQRP